MGRSRPCSRANRSQTSGVAFSPRMAVQGSPGIRRARANVTNKIPSSTGIDERSRRTMYSVISRPSFPPTHGGSRDGAVLRSLRHPAIVYGVFKGDLRAILFRSRSAPQVTPERDPVLERAGVAHVQR